MVDSSADSSEWSIDEVADMWIDRHHGTAIEGPLARAIRLRAKEDPPETPMPEDSATVVSSETGSTNTAG